MQKGLKRKASRSPSSFLAPEGCICQAWATTTGLPFLEHEMAVSYWLTNLLRSLTLASLELVHLQPEHPTLCPHS